MRSILVPIRDGQILKSRLDDRDLTLEQPGIDEALGVAPALVQS